MRRGSLLAYMHVWIPFFPTWDKWQPEMGNCWRRFFLFLQKKITMAAWDGELLELLYPKLGKTDSARAVIRGASFRIRRGGRVWK
jgi:hypothetical protein